MSDETFVERATSTDWVEKRSGVNRKLSDADFDQWVHSWLDCLPAESVLDLYWGTGNQLVLYAKREDCRNITGVDLSRASLNTAASFQ